MLVLCCLQVLEVQRGRGFAALHHWESLAPEVKEEAYAVVSRWLMDELPNLQPAAARAEKPSGGGAVTSAGWTLAGVGGGLLVGGGLVAGGFIVAVPGLAMGAALVGGALGYAGPGSQASRRGVFECLRECGRGLREPLVILLHAAPALREAKPAKWRALLDSKPAPGRTTCLDLAQRLLDETYRNQCTAKFARLTRAPFSPPFYRGADPLDVAYHAACALRLAHTSDASLWYLYPELTLVQSEYTGHRRLEPRPDGRLVRRRAQ
jgi:hypothetical protein